LFVVARLVKGVWYAQIVGAKQSFGDFRGVMRPAT